LPDPTHWWTVMGSAEVSVEGRTVHRTRMVPPPPVPESLHWVTVAFVAFAGNGLQRTVGSVPPPVPAWLHWLTVAGEVVAWPVMLLTMDTEQVTVPPPPLPEPSHCVTEVTSWFEGVIVVTQVSAALANPWHSTSSVVELATPVLRSRLLVTVTVQLTAWPPTLSVPLHWLTPTPAAFGRGERLSSAVVGLASRVAVA